MTRAQKKALVALCDNEWIKSAWTTWLPGDWYYDRKDNELKQVCDNDLIKNVDFAADRYVWLPLGFTPETCQMELDELLQAAGHFKDEDSLGDAYHAWREREEDGQLVQMVGSHVLLKLEWLKQLLEKK